jgi:hypothetical protein
MRFDLQRIGRIAGDFSIDSAGAAANEPSNTATTGGSGDSRQVDIAPQRGADDHDLARPGQLARRFVAFVNEIGHGCVNLAAELRSARRC